MGLLYARAVLPGGLAAATLNIPTLGGSLTFCRARRFPRPGEPRYRLPLRSGPGVLDSYSGERTEGQPQRVPASGVQAQAALAGEPGRRRGRCPGKAPRRTARLSLGQASRSCVSFQDS